MKEREIAEALAEKQKVLAEKQKEERAKQEFYLKSLAVCYPEKVAELWDYEKNGTLKPEDVPAGTTSQLVWLKCPLDGNSWQKKPNAITRSWDRGSSGCPICAGKMKKREKQPSLIEVYPELISQYWDYEKNNNLNLDPTKIRLFGSKYAKK